MPCRQVSTFNGTAASSGSYATEAECNQACKEGACCEGTTCTVKPQCQCQGAGQVFKGVGTTCTPNPCCPGANVVQDKCNPGLQPATIYLRFEGTGSVTLNRTFPLEYEEATNRYKIPDSSFFFEARTGTVGCSFPGAFGLPSGCSPFYESPSFGVRGYFGTQSNFSFIYTDYKPGSNCGCDYFLVPINSLAYKLCWLCDPTRQEDFLFASVGSALTSHGEVTQTSPKAWLSKNPLP